jgi:hypothetical protein
MQPTPEDLKNGWTPETLTDYHESIKDETARFFGPRKPPLPTRANSKYSPHRGLGCSPFDRFRRGR